MNAVSFDRKVPLVIVPVTMKKGNEIVRYDFAIDTGATVSLIDVNLLKWMGFKEEDSIRTIQTITASKSETAYEFQIENIMALGLIRRNFKVISRSLPVGLGIDGLLGLNFFKNKELTIDFKLSEIRIQ